MNLSMKQTWSKRVLNFLSERRGAHRTQATGKEAGGATGTSQAPGSDFRNFETTETKHPKHPKTNYTVTSN